MAETAEQQDDIRMIPLNQLVLSDLNMRKEGTDPKSDKALKASLKSQRVLQNFIVHPTADPYSYGVAAGGRRHRLLNELVDEGEIPEDLPIPCKVVPETDALAMSIAENRNREDAHPADEFMAFKALIDAGEKQKDVATRYGVSNKYVSQRMRLAEVHPQIIEAYRKDKIQLPAVMAYTIEPDQEKQLECFTQGGYKAFTPHLIREFLVKTELTSKHRSVRFIGLQTYKRAGGRTSTDLFEDDVMVLDPDLVERLAKEKLEAIAQPVRDEGWSWVSVTADRPGNMWHYQEEDAKYPDALQAEHEKLLKAEDDADEAIWNRGDDDEELDAGRWEELHEVSRKAQEAREQFEREHDHERQFTDEQKARSGTFVFIGFDGQPEIHRGMSKLGEEQSSDSATGADDDDEKERPRHSRAVVEDLAYHRTQAFRVALTAHPDLVMTLLHFAICDSVFGDEHRPTFIKIGPDPDYQIQSRPFKTSDTDQENEPAVVELRKLEKQLPLGWTKPDNVAGRFWAFQELRQSEIRKLTMHAVLRKVIIPECGMDPLADLIVNEVEPDFLSLITLTKDNLFGRIGKPELLEIVEQELGQARADELKKNKKGEIAQLVHDLYNDHNVRSREGKDFYPTWIPEEF